MRFRNAVAVLLLTVASAGAGEIDILVNSLAEKGIISYGEAQSIVSETREDIRAKTATGVMDTYPQWIQNLSFKGDLRLRHQADWAYDSNAKNYYARTRERLRLRLGAESRFVDGVKAAFGLATGSEKLYDRTVLSTTTGVAGDTINDAEPTSTNHTFDNGFAKAMLMVDYAYLQYTPLPWLTVTGGKMKAGQQLWNTTDLLWDTDINPDGVALNATHSIGSANLFLNAAWLTLKENNKNGVSNPDAYILQPGAQMQATSKLSVKGAVALQQFNVNGRLTGYYGTPAFDYQVINPSIELVYKELFGYTASIFGDTAVNSDKKPDNVNTDASCWGLRFGDEKIAEFGQWQVSGLQRKIAANAWLSKLGDSDAYGGASNSAGYEIILAMGLTRSATLSLDYYNMDAITGSDPNKTPKSLIQFDIVYKF